MQQTSFTVQPLISKLANDPDVADLLMEFLQELRTRAENLAKAYEDCDTPTVTFIAHQMKGTAGLFGYQQITSAAARVESLVAQNPTTVQLQTSVDELLNLCSRACAVLPTTEQR